MPDGSKPERDSNESGTARWATVNLAVALVLVLAIGAVQLRADLANAAGLALLIGLGLLALISAALLFRSFLNR